jgi:hypothetical protein
MVFLLKELRHVMATCLKESKTGEKVRSVVVNSGRTRRKMEMQALSRTVMPKDHQGDPWRAVEGIFGRIGEPSLDHDDVAGTENALRFEANTGVRIGIDL